MKEWIGKKPEKEKEDEEKRQDRLAQRRSMPNHKFDDPQYEKQKCQVTENLQDAFRTGRGNSNISREHLRYRIHNPIYILYKFPTLANIGYKTAGIYVI